MVFRSIYKINDIGQNYRLKRQNVAKVVGITYNERFLVLFKITAAKNLLAIAFQLCKSTTL